MEMRIGKEFKFESAHQLVGHEGNCAHLHGHSYRLIVEVYGPLVGEGSSEGMVYDYADLSEVVKSVVIDRMDHAFLAEGNEPCLGALIDSGSKVYHLGMRTTAENLSIHIWGLLCEAFAFKGFSGGISKVRVMETALTYAEINAEDDSGIHF